MTQARIRRRKKRAPGWHPGIAVRAARDRLGLDQGELAVLLAEVSDEFWDQSKVSRLETGELKMTSERLRLVSRVQKMSYDFYLDGPVEETNRSMGLYISSAAVA